MANATLAALINEFKQYGDTPQISSDAVNRLHDAIVAITGGAVNPPLDQLGNNHTYWLAVALQFAASNSSGSTRVDVFSTTGSVITFVSGLAPVGWGIYDTAGNVASLIGPASGPFDLNTGNRFFLLANSLSDAQSYLDFSGILSNLVLDMESSIGGVNLFLQTPGPVDNTHNFSLVQDNPGTPLKGQADDLVSLSNLGVIVM